jgi:hypothetical protein
MAAVLLKRSFSIIFNSDPDTGAENVSEDGNEFQVTLNKSIMIPPNAVDCQAGVIQASIWNTSPNVAVDFTNNSFRFTTSVAPANTYTLTIPDGLYSVAGLNSYLSGQFVNLGLPSNLMSISGNEATQKSVVTILTSGDSVDFTIVNSVRTVLGFNSAVITAPSANYSFFSDNVAAFNRVNNFVIASNFVSQGIPFNSRSAGIISIVPIDKDPGSQISYSPQNVVWFDARDLIGNPRSNLQFRLLDQNLRPVIVVDPFSFTLAIKYTEFMGSGTLAKS